MSARMVAHQPVVKSLTAALCANPTFPFALQGGVNNTYSHRGAVAAAGAAGVTAPSKVVSAALKSDALRIYSNSAYL